MTPQELARGLSGAVTPDLRLSVVPLPGRGFGIRVSLENVDTVPTALAEIDHNYVEVHVGNGRIAAVQRGGFHRYQLGSGQGEAFQSGNVRRAPTLRLYYPMLQPGWKVEGAVVRIETTAAEPNVSIASSFLLPSGQTATSGPLDWHRLVGSGPAGEAAEEGEP